MNTSEFTRDSWGAINEASVDPATLAQVRAMIGELAAGTADHNGQWDFGIVSSSNNKRWAALNYSIYHIDTDIHTGDLLAIVQVRRAESGRRWTKVQKSYFLIGRNEDNMPFAHCINPQVAHAGILSAQRWIFGADYSKVIRQGDVCLIPVKARRGERDSKRTVVIQGSHKLSCSSLYRDGDNLYARNPKLTHIPGTHPNVSATGTFKVVLGKRDTAWDFAKLKVD